MFTSKDRPTSCDVKPHKPSLTQPSPCRRAAAPPGHAMFLRMTGEAGPKEELRFLVKARVGAVVLGVAVAMRLW